MGLLFSRVAAFFSSQQDYKMVIVGLDNAGKTATLFHMYVPMVGVRSGLV
jgi:hypothetical protein